ncbi:S-adenosylmethionine:diacylglycerol 3-amino-3-carboxypropyl transferase [Asticcacaulis biprosthecium C19]|uniref:S-adenosylmethionine:diacylglycerol 3-amino-3-carboxypropyl transferase n=1 Tax=Asticcacaulis biprosthecium C19 TaxID=715226 RepID=F4QT68_9CAUL|nr:DUF3419 family protein [Asticcacaulis biprosthecium]EGF89938.1 S-adenosylmethionine:diacylglycerol 3-amino-3-carboxypropyl transferase [Asticcacaulis biprosthecium C19]
MNFFTSLNFTSSNEDGETELRALDIRQGERVLCLTASGTRPLDLLMSDAAEVVALDLNPAQNQLLALKVAALRTLESDDLYAFLGLTGGDRMALYRKVRPALGDPAFWDDRPGVIRAGVWYAGRWEKVLRLGAFGTGIIRGRHIDDLFAAETLVDQSAIWRRHFDDGLWRAAIRSLSGRFFWQHVIGEPGGAFLPDADGCVDRLTAAFRDAAGRFFFRDSDFAWLIFRGRHHPDALPIHLRRDNLPVVRQRLDRLTIVNGGLAEMSRLGRFDAFSLSDFGSYCDVAAYHACWRGVQAVARPGARYCERVFMNPLPAPVAVDDTLSAHLTCRDKAIIYHIRAGLLVGKDPDADHAAADMTHPVRVELDQVVVADDVLL